MDPMVSDAVALHGVTALHPNRGQLKHGNRGGDPSSSPRCGARNRSGAPCGSPAMWSQRSGSYTRCWRHGGRSSGPKTAAGLERSKRARWKHGLYSAEHKQRRRELRAFLCEERAELLELQRMLRAQRKANGNGTVVGYSSPLLVIGACSSKL